VRQCPLVGELSQPRMIDGPGSVGENGNWVEKKLNVRRSHAPAPIRPPQNAHDLTWDRI
jgi:hypothetical protein